MRSSVRIYGNQDTINEFKREITGNVQWSSLRQLVNVAQLPGVINPVIAMADVHPGYGFPIGAVGAFDIDQGVVSVAGVGFDCNCGVRVLTTNLEKKDIAHHQEHLANSLFNKIPAGVGSKGTLRLNTQELNRLLRDGAEYIIKKGYGIQDDIEYIEERGRLDGADPANVSPKAKERQFKQVGTLGSGNHYLEVQYVEEIYDRDAARAFGLEENQITIAIHCGSRALGHQIGTDYLKVLASATNKYKIPIPDKELVSAPVKSPEAHQYLSATACAVNCAFANRQVLGHLARKVFCDIFSVEYEEIKMLYDVGHNNAKIELHNVGGRQRKVLIHRKGSTRALGPGGEDLPDAYRETGQPVLVGGTMGTASYVLRGTRSGMESTFGSAVHGAGRKMSRHEAKKKWRARELIDDLRGKNIIIKGVSFSGISEEAPLAYKDVDEVVDIVHTAGVNLKVARLKPLICIKG